MKVQNKILLLVIIVMLIITGCSPVQADTMRVVAEAQIPILEGQVLAVQAGQTLYGMRMALAEKAGTGRLVKDTLILMFWPMKDGYAFSIVDMAKQEVVYNLSKTISGNLVRIKTFEDFIAALQKDGWQKVVNCQICEELKYAIGTSGPAFATWMAKLSSSMTTFMVLPVGSLTTPEDLMLEFYNLEDL